MREWLKLETLKACKGVQRAQTTNLRHTSMLAHKRYRSLSRASCVWIFAHLLACTLSLPNILPYIGCLFPLVLVLLGLSRAIDLLPMFCDVYLPLQPSGVSRHTRFKSSTAGNSHVGGRCACSWCSCAGTRRALPAFCSAVKLMRSPIKVCCVLRWVHASCLACPLRIFATRLVSRFRHAAHRYKGGCLAAPIFSR